MKDEGQTEGIGDLPFPDHWVLTTLGKVCSKPQYGWTTSASDKGTLKLLRTTDLTKGSIDWDAVPFCEDNPPDISKFLVEKDDIFISRAGSVGVSVLMDMIEVSAVFASYLIRIKCLEKIRPKYLKYFLESPEYWRQISDMSAGIALQNVNATKLKLLELPLPPLEEQEQVTKILDQQCGLLNRAIENIQLVNVKATQFRQSLLHAAFTGALTGSGGGGK